MDLARSLPYLATFFAQVFDPSIDDDDEAYVLWIGAAPQAIPSVAALQAQLVGWVVSLQRAGKYQRPVW